MRGRGVRVVHQRIVHVLVIRTDPLAQPHLLDPLSVLLARPLLPRPRLHVVVRVVKLRLLAPAVVILLLLHAKRMLLLLLLLLLVAEHHFFLNK